MNPPASVRVGPHTYRLVMVPDGVMDDAGRVGHCCPERLVIALDSGQRPSQLADTILHELVHALLRSVDLESAEEERVCLALGPGLLALVRDNPSLVAWLTRSTL